MKYLKVAYQFGDEWYGFPPGPDVGHAVDVAVEGIVAWMPGYPKQSLVGCTCKHP